MAAIMKSKTKVTNDGNEAKKMILMDERSPPLHKPKTPMPDP
jgi:hypothetical protein